MQTLSVVPGKKGNGFSAEEGEISLLLVPVFYFDSVVMAFDT